MAKKFYYKSYKKSFKTIPDIMHHMTELQQELAGTDLANLQYFNQTYYIITKHVAAQTGTFVHDDLMQALDIVFARYYFDALHAYINSKQTTPAWAVMFDLCRTNTSFGLLYLALGVNAHVQNDLGLALYDVIDQKTFKKDFDRVNGIIANSLSEVLTVIHEPVVYKPFMKQLIAHWRSDAWNNYEKLSTYTLTKKEIETNAHQLACTLLPINSHYKLPMLYRLFL